LNEENEQNQRQGGFQLSVNEHNLIDLQASASSLAFDLG
jgi:hypothetical protein